MSGPLSPLEIRIEYSKCFSNARLDFLKRLADRRSISEQYLNGDGNIHVHFRVGVEIGALITCVTLELGSVPLMITARAPILRNRLCLSKSLKSLSLADQLHLL